MDSPFADDILYLDFTFLRWHISTVIVIAANIIAAIIIAKITETAIISDNAPLLVLLFGSVGILEDVAVSTFAVDDVTDVRKICSKLNMSLYYTDN